MITISVTIPLWIKSVYDHFLDDVQDQLGTDPLEAWWIASTEPPSEAVQRILVCDWLAWLG